MAGNNWKTDEQKKIEGTYRADRAKSSPVKSQLITDIPPPSKESKLNEYGKKIFRHYCRTLIHQKRLRDTEINLLESLAYQFQLKLECKQIIEDLGQIIQYGETKPIIKDGQMVTFPLYQNNPAITTLFKTEDYIIKYCTQLAVTPISESRLNIAQDDDESEAAKLLT